MTECLGVRSQIGVPFQELLQYYVMERFLYRLSKSKFRNAFVLKGALLLTAWRAPQSRPTIDIGFGDVIVHHAAEIEYPVLLEFAAPYSRETVVAEKLEAITVLGLLNSRMKDYFDLMLLSRLYEFDGAVLHRAVGAT